MPRRKKTISPDIKHLYLMMNKPCGYVCSSVSDRSPVVFDLVPERLLSYCTENSLSLHTVGRLDKDTSGLLLLTTDGHFSHRLTSPESHVQKIYEVTLENEESLERQSEIAALFSRGIMLPPEKKAPEQASSPAELEWLMPDRCRLAIAEGKFHQVRRMFRAAGNEVKALKRLAVGETVLPPDLLEGQVQIISIVNPQEKC
ncbi:MAG: pseudouridine synthase [Treponema sp.]|nr:pseudouridine synthase [Treponema sp.]